MYYSEQTISSPISKILNTLLYLNKIFYRVNVTDYGYIFFLQVNPFHVQPPSTRESVLGHVDLYFSVSIKI